MSELVAIGFEEATEADRVLTPAHLALPGAGSKTAGGDFAAGNRLRIAGFVGRFVSGVFDGIVGGYCRVTSSGLL
jgi:hypothetical protein